MFKAATTFGSIFTSAVSDRIQQSVLYFEETLKDKLIRRALSFVYGYSKIEQTSGTSKIVQDIIIDKYPLVRIISFLIACVLILFLFWFNRSSTRKSTASKSKTD